LKSWGESPRVGKKVIRVWINEERPGDGKEEREKVPKKKERKHCHRKQKTFRKTTSARKKKLANTHVEWVMAHQKGKRRCEGGGSAQLGGKKNEKALKMNRIRTMRKKKGRHRHNISKREERLSPMKEYATGRKLPVPEKKSLEFQVGGGKDNNPNQQCLSKKSGSATRENIGKGGERHG